MAKFDVARTSPLGTDLLFRDGPVIEVLLTAPVQYLTYLREHGLPPFPIVSGLAILDTGASISVLESDVMDELQIPALERSESWTVHGKSTSGVYNASASFPSIDVLSVPLRRVLRGHVCAETYDGKDIIMLVGRDILRDWTVTFHGPEQRFSIEV